jgi:DNA recombination protein RmuC
MNTLSADLLATLAVGVLVLLALGFAHVQQSARTAALERRLRDDQEAMRGLIAALDVALRKEIAAGTRGGMEAAFDRVQAAQKQQGEQLVEFGRFQREAIDQSLRVFGERLVTLESAMRQEQEMLRAQVAERLELMRSGNEKKLDEMRQAVDEKLQAALEKQLRDSFANLQEQLGAVQQAIGQVQTVAGEVGDLKRLFSNVKSRGGWGEAQLEAMLTDLLPPGAFEKNMQMREGSRDLVEFALRVPGRDGGHAWLPVDSKFPTEDYARLIAASEAGLRDDEEDARRALRRNLLLEAGKIRDKYIAPPRTLDVAILYLPSDSLFAEIARIPGLIEQVRRDSNTMVMGPSLLPAFLHTLRVSYATLALEQKAGKIGEMLAAVKLEWGKFGEALAAIKKQADNLSTGIDKTLVRQRAIERKLRGVDAVENVQSEIVLGLDDKLAIESALDEE